MASRRSGAAVTRLVQESRAGLYSYLSISVMQTNKNPLLLKALYYSLGCKPTLSAGLYMTIDSYDILTVNIAVPTLPRYNLSSKKPLYFNNTISSSMCKMCVCVCLGVFPTAAASVETRLDRELVREGLYSLMRHYNPIYYSLKYS